MWYRWTNTFLRLTFYDTHTIKQILWYLSLSITQNYVTLSCHGWPMFLMDDKFEKSSWIRFWVILVKYSTESLEILQKAVVKYSLVTNRLIISKSRENVKDICWHIFCGFLCNLVIKKQRQILHMLLSGHSFQNWRRPNYKMNHILM